MHISTAVVAASVSLLSTAGLTYGQTSSQCNPTKGDKCPPDPAFGRAPSEFDFVGASWDDGSVGDFWRVDGAAVYRQDQNIELGSGRGAKFVIRKEDDAPTLTSKKYLFFGRVEVEVQAAPGQGIITSIALQSDILDEIDWEWIGSAKHEVQTNFFARGDPEWDTYSNKYIVDFDTTAGVHTYAVEWTPTELRFFIDGQLKKSQSRKVGSDEKWPQTPCQVKIGTWVAGKGSDKGRIDWGGGMVEWNKAPFVAIYRRVRLMDYMGADRGCAAAQEYVYSDRSGTMESIDIVGCGSKGGGGGGNSTHGNSTHGGNGNGNGNGTVYHLLSRSGDGGDGSGGSSTDETNNNESKDRHEGGDVTTKRPGHMVNGVKFGNMSVPGGNYPHHGPMSHRPETSIVPVPAPAPARARALALDAVTEGGVFGTATISGGALVTVALTMTLMLLGEMWG